MKAHIPEFIAVGNRWEPNIENIEMIGEPLFVTVESVEVFHGDGYWAFPDNDRKTSGNWVIANAKFDYNDGIERFKHKSTMQDAISAFTWLNS